MSASKGLEPHGGGGERLSPQTNEIKLRLMLPAVKRTRWSTRWSSAGPIGGTAAPGARGRHAGLRIGEISSLDPSQCPGAAPDTPAQYFIDAIKDSNLLLF